MIEQRKTVSIVFADLVESTALAESVDVERLAGILSSYFNALRSAIQERGGTVEKFIGDAVVGVFGVPVLHEDDALRAVKAALAMKVAIAELNDELGTQGDINLAVRIGVNTGEVAVTAAGTLGHAISIAARLEQAAQPGEILIGADTYALTRTSLVATPIEPLTVKGSRVPLGAWSVTAVRVPPTPGLSAGRAFIGRDDELAAIGSALDAAVRDSECIRVTVVAPPGLGKSRLIAEALARVPVEAHILMGRCPSYGEGTAYAPLVEMISQLTAASGDSALDGVLAGQPDASAVATVVRASVTGSAPVSADETAWAFRRLFESIAKKEPLVVVVEDLHWADSLLLDLLEYVASTAKMAPILLLCAARPDFVAVMEHLAATSVRSVLVHLNPLTTDETQILLASLGADLMDSDLSQRIIATSGGVPLFVEQMRAFESDDSAEGSRGAVPPTIRALLAARVDRLDPNERSILERGAIEGQAFRMTTLLELLPAPAPASLTPSLATLMDREFIRSERAAAGADEAFAFSHALMRDAVYEAMPRRRRAELHERYGIKIQEAHAAPEIVGYHLATAYQERVALGEGGAAAPLAIKAGRAFHEAGRNSVARREASRSVELLRRSEELLRPHSSEWLEAVPTLISALVDLPDYEAADALHEEAVATARELGDETAELRAEIALALSGYARGVPGWQTSAIQLADRALNHFETVGADADIVDALIVKGYGESMTSASALIKTLNRARLHAQRINDEAALIMVWDELGGAMLLGDTPYSEVADYVDEEMLWAEEHGIPFTLIDARLSLAYIHAGRGEFDAARESLALIREVLAGLPGRISHYGESYVLSGQIERDAGHPEAAAEAYRRAIDVFEHNRPWQRIAMSNLALALIDLGRVDEARGLLDTVETDFASDMNREEPERLMAEARYLSVKGDIANAIPLARRAVALAGSTGDLIISGRSHELLGRLLLASGERDEALVELDHALTTYSRKEYVPGQTRVETAIASTMSAS